MTSGLRLLPEPLGFD